MEKLQFFGKVFLLTIFFCLLFFVVEYADTIRNVIASQIFTTGKAVAGAQTSFEDEVKDNISDYTEEAKEKVLNVKVADVVSGFSRAKKIVHDANNIKKYIVDQVNLLLKK